MEANSKVHLFVKLWNKQAHQTNNQGTSAFHFENGWQCNAKTEPTFVKFPSIPLYRCTLSKYTPLMNNISLTIAIFLKVSEVSHSYWLKLANRILLKKFWAHFSISDLPFSLGDNNKVPTKIFYFIIFLNRIDSVAEETLHSETHMPFLKNSKCC